MKQPSPEMMFAHKSRKSEMSQGEKIRMMQNVSLRHRDAPVTIEKAPWEEDQGE